MSIPNMFSSLLSQNMIEDVSSKMKTYIYPEEAKFKEKLEWVFRRIWNAVKHLFGQSDWQFARKRLAEEFKVIPLNAAAMNHFAEAILLCSVDKKACTALSSFSGLQGLIPAT